MNAKVQHIYNLCIKSHSAAIPNMVFRGGTLSTVLAGGLYIVEKFCMAASWYYAMMSLWSSRSMYFFAHFFVSLNPPPKLLNQRQPASVKHWLFTGLSDTQLVKDLTAFLFMAGLAPIGLMSWARVGNVGYYALLASAFKLGKYVTNIAYILYEMKIQRAFSLQPPPKEMDRFLYTCLRTPIGAKRGSISFPLSERALNRDNFVVMMGANNTIAVNNAAIFVWGGGANAQIVQ
jgi:hypothetical protein